MKHGKKREATADEKEFFDRSGYLVLKKCYSPDECDEMLSLLERHANSDYAPLMNPHSFAYLRAFDPRPNNVRINSQIEETSSYLQDLMRDPRSITVLASLYGKSFDGLMSQMLFKEAGSAYAPQAWNPHQDNDYVKSPNALYVTTNLFLDDALFENGTMYIYPGSHKMGLFPSKKVVSFREVKGSNPGNITEIPGEFKDKEELINFDKGDLLVLHGNVLHGSYANISKVLSRPLYMNTYIPPEEDFNPGKIARRTRINLYD